MKTLVLGSGVSALSYLYYHKDAFALAGEEPGGLFARQSKLGPQLIWKDSLTEKLLTDLGLPLETRQIKIGYYDNDEIVPGNLIPEERFRSIKEAYAYKTRNQAAKPSHMSGGVKTFEAYTVGVDVLVRRLVDAVQFRLELASAEFIDLYHKRVIDTNSFDYTFDQLISTVPAGVFLKLTQREQFAEQLHAFDKAYVHVENADLPEWATQNADFDYAYIASSEIPFHRIKYTPTGAILEYTLKGTPPPTGKNVILHLGGQIIGGHEIFNSLPPYVTLLGRYAAWKHEIKLNQALEIIHGK